MPASPSSWAVAPCMTSIASTPMKTWSRVICASTSVASGPVSSYEAGRATPPVTTSFTWRRTTSSLAMFSALVTTVSEGSGALGTQLGADGQRPGDRGGRGAAVQTHHGARLHQARRRVGDPLLLRSVARGLVAERQVVRDRVDHGAAMRAGDHLLARQLVQITPDRGGGDPQFVRGGLDLDPPVARQHLQQRAPSGLWCRHASSPVPGGRARCTSQTEARI